ncbi:MAG TPA: PIN domain-containing protein [Polyangiaceae bacterium]
MKLLFDSSVWIDHLRYGALDDVIPALRGRFTLWLDSVVMAELSAGCRSKPERRIVERLVAPFERSGRIATPLHADFRKAAAALSALRSRGKTLASPGGALLDALIMAIAGRMGALVVSTNLRDFAALSPQIPATYHPFPVFLERVLAVRR